MSSISWAKASNVAFRILKSDWNRGTGVRAYNGTMKFSYTSFNESQNSSRMWWHWLITWSTFSVLAYVCTSVLWKELRRSRLKFRVQQSTLLPMRWNGHKFCINNKRNFIDWFFSLFSVYLFLAEVSKLEATSVNAIKVTSTLSRIQSPTLTVS